VDKAHQLRNTVESKIVIVIDDDDAVRDSVGILLEAHGLEVRSFPSARDFLCSEELLTAGCLLLDYHMPGMTGLELMIELYRRGLPYPTIMITGLSDGTIRRRALAAGALAVLRKGAPDTVLVEAVRGALKAQIAARKSG
jgi:FixJ family two-component response regulator